MLQLSIGGSRRKNYPNHGPATLHQSLFSRLLGSTVLVIVWAKGDVISFTVLCEVTYLSLGINQETILSVRSLILQHKQIKQGYKGGQKTLIFSALLEIQHFL